MIRLLIKTIFKIIGAAAAAANLLLEFKIPEKKDDKLTKSKKGNVILVNSTAISNFNPVSMNPGAIKQTRQGVKISTNVTKNNNIIIKRLNISSANFFPCFLFDNFAAVQLGINAALNVPSANNLLKVLGNLNATKKASAKIEAPKKIAIKMSLRYPKILLIRVKKLNNVAEESKFINYLK